MLSWADKTVEKLARYIYDRKDWKLVGVLGDAVEQSGVSIPGVLEALRGPGPFFRGNWAIDMLAGMY